MQTDDVDEINRYRGYFHGSLLRPAADNESHGPTDRPTEGVCSGLAPSRRPRSARRRRPRLTTRRRRRGRPAVAAAAAVEYRFTGGTLLRRYDGPSVAVPPCTGKSAVVPVHSTKWRRENFTSVDRLIEIWFSVNSRLFAETCLRSGFSTAN